MIAKWKKRELGDIATFFSGGTPSKSNPEYWGDDIPWITVRDMKSMYYSKSTLSLTEMGASTLRVMPAGTIYILVRGMGLFKDLPVLYCDRPATFNQDIKGIIPKDGLNPEFLAYSLIANKSDILRLVDSAGHGTGRLDTDLLKSVPFVIPPSSVQSDVVRILRTWDEAIEKCQLIVQKLIQRRNALSSRLLSEGHRNGRRIEFGDILEESRIAGSDGSSARKITVKLYGKGAIEKSENYSGSKNTRYFIRTKGQLIYSKLDFLNGAFAIIPDELDGFETTLDLPAFNVSTEVNSAWLLEYLTRPSYYTRQDSIARGQRKARRVSPEEFLKSNIRLPNIETQNRQAEMLCDADEEVSFSTALLKSLERQKRGLMQKLLTGIWRVKL